MYSVTVGFSPILYYYTVDPNLLLIASRNPFKLYEELFLSLPPIISPFFVHWVIAINRSFRFVNNFLKLI